MSEQVQVEITGLVSTSRYGNLTPGTILRTDPDFAKHLVEEAGAAKYVTAISVAETPAKNPRAVSKPKAK
jgi:hypothetical protein